MDQHEVALMPDEGIQSGLAWRVLFHRCHRVRGFLRDRLLLRGRKSAPGWPTQTHHLVKDAVAFGGERNGGVLACNLGTRLVSCGHENVFPLVKRLLYAVRRCAKNIGSPLSTMRI